MWEDVFRVLICVVIGSGTGFVLLRAAPERCAQFTEWSRSPKRAILYMISFVVFSGVAIVNLLNGNVVYSIVGAALAILELAALGVVRRRNDTMNF